MMAPHDAQLLRVAFALFDERLARVCAPAGSIRGGGAEKLTIEDFDEFNEAADACLSILDGLARSRH